MILATKTGWLVLVKLIEERERRIVVKDVENKVYTVRKSDPTRKVFAGTQEAIDWIMEGRA